MVFELMKQHLIEDDKELNKIYKAYKSGKMTSGELKEIACHKMSEFLASFERKLIKAKRQVKRLTFI